MQTSTLDREATDGWFARSIATRVIRYQTDSQSGELFEAVALEYVDARQDLRIRRRRRAVGCGCWCHGVADLRRVDGRV